MSATGIPATLAELSVPIESLRPYSRNPRRGDLEAIRRSLEVNGQYRPVVARAGSGEILAGNHTYAAALELGWTAIAATFVEVDDEQAARIVLVDNRTADRAGYDDAELVALLQSLPDLEGTAWMARELDRLLDELGVGASGDAGRDTEPEPPPAQPTARAGDVWELGGHRLVCGDSADPATLERLLGDEQAAMVWTDPPYGVAYQVTLTDPDYARRRRQDGLVVAGDDLGEAEHEAMLRAALGHALERCQAGAPWYVTAPAGPRELVFARVLHELGVLRETLVWIKDVFVFGRQDYHWQHEPILYGWKPGGAHPWHADRAEATVIDDEALAGLGRRELVALVRRLQNERHTTAIREDRPRVSTLHPTMKPVGLIAQQLANSSSRGDLVLDPFAGSGSTMIAADNLERRCYAAELDPRYADVIVDRWQRHTGGKARRRRRAR